MRRGFKAEAERTSLEVRKLFKLDECDPIDPWAYAAHLNILVLNVEDTDLAIEHKTQLLANDSDSWSGLSMLHHDQHVVVLNESHPKTRQRATLSHEIAHIVLDHFPSEISVSESGLYLLSDYSDEQEAEADWLGAALLLPYPALLKYRSSGETVSRIAKTFGISEDLCRWRCNITGIERRIGQRTRRRIGG